LGFGFDGGEERLELEILGDSWRFLEILGDFWVSNWRGELHQAI